MLLTMRFLEGKFLKFIALQVQDSIRTNTVALELVNTESGTQLESLNVYPSIAT